MKSQLLTFAAAACAAALLATTQDASAWFTRVHAMNCLKSGTSGVMFVFESGIGNSGAQSTGRLTAICPLQDGSASNHVNINTLNLHVFDGNNALDAGVVATPCVATFAAIGSTCGGIQNTHRVSRTFTGQDTLTLGADASTLFRAQQAGDFKYVKVIFTHPGVLGNSMLSGYFAEGT